jgi:hypothetical protein
MFASAVPSPSGYPVWPTVNTANYVSTGNYGFIYWGSFCEGANPAPVNGRQLAYYQGGMGVGGTYGCAAPGGVAAINGFNIWPGSTWNGLTLVSFEDGGSYGCGAMTSSSYWAVYWQNETLNSISVSSCFLQSPSRSGTIVPVYKTGFTVPPGGVVKEYVYDTPWTGVAGVPGVIAHFLCAPVATPPTATITASGGGPTVTSSSTTTPLPTLTVPQGTTVNLSAAFTAATGDNFTSTSITNSPTATSITGLPAGSGDTFSPLNYSFTPVAADVGRTFTFTAYATTTRCTTSTALASVNITVTAPTTRTVNITAKVTPKGGYQYWIKPASATKTINVQ